ncbi:hypothetical protein P3S68_009225 [Capsicum galapagoense]
MSPKESPSSSPIRHSNDLFSVCHVFELVDYLLFEYHLCLSWLSYLRMFYIEPGVYRKQPPYLTFEVVVWRPHLVGIYWVCYALIDEWVTVTRWSKKQKAQIPGRSMELDDWKWKAMEIRSTGWDDSDTSSSISKIVESVGEAVEELKEGNSVVLIFLLDCMDCSLMLLMSERLILKSHLIRHAFSTVEYQQVFFVLSRGSIGNSLATSPEVVVWAAYILPSPDPTVWEYTGFVVVVVEYQQVIIEMTNGGADYCFECVGLAQLMQEPFAYCRKEFQLDKFVTHEVNFEDINNAFELLIQGKSLRCVI